MTTEIKSAPTPKMPTGGILVRLTNWLAVGDIRRRRREQLRRLPDHTLRDIGMTRDQANAQFYSRFGDRPADRKRAIMNTRAWL